MTQNPYPDRIHRLTKTFFVSDMDLHIEKTNYTYAPTEFFKIIKGTRIEIDQNEYYELLNVYLFGLKSHTIKKAKDTTTVLDVSGDFFASILGDNSHQNN